MISDIPAFIRENTRVLARANSRDQAASRRRRGCAVAADRRAARRTRLAAAVLGVCVGRRASAGALSARSLPKSCAASNVLDVASGSGLVAIAAMKAGAEHACAADIDAFAAHAARLNAELNGVTIDTSDADPSALPAQARSHPGRRSFLRSRSGAARARLADRTASRGQTRADRRSWAHLSAARQTRTNRRLRHSRSPARSKTRRSSAPQCGS